MEKTAAAAAALPDDLVEEILVRLDDAAALFRCTTACKTWRSLVARPSFLRRHWPEDSAGESCSLFGFFAPQEKEHGGEQIFVPAPRSPLRRCSLGSFFPEEATGWLEHAEPITSRRWLLLVLIRPPVSTGCIRLALCNPLAGTCDVLPPLNCNITDFDTNACGILTGADLLYQKGQQKPLTGYSTFFKVLVCVHHDVWGEDSERVASGYELYMFSSNESSWTEPQDCFLQINSSRLEMMGCAVVCRGAAYWLLKSSTNYYALQLSADTGHVSFTKLWLDTSYAAWFDIGTNGAISLFRPSCQDQIEIWTCRDGDSTTEWLCTGMIKLERLKHMPEVGPLSGALLFSYSGMHVADLTTGTMEDVTAQFSGLDGRYSVPLEVNWLDFFSSRLRGRNYHGATTSLP